MDFIILKVNGEDVQNFSHEEAMQVFQRTHDPIINVEVMRRPSTNLSASASAAPTFPPTSGGLLTGSGENGSVDVQSELSSGGVGHEPSRCCATVRSVAVQTVLSAGELAASLALAAASFAQQEARMALMGESAHAYCMPGKHPVDYLLGIPGVTQVDRVGEDGLEDSGDEEEDDAVIAVDEVGCLDHILKRYPSAVAANGLLPPSAFCYPLPQTDSVYANFPDNAASTSSVEYTEKFFEVVLQKQSATDKFGLTLCYRQSDVHQNLTEVYISEIEPGSVAYRCGQIMLDDRVVKIGDQEITSREHVIELFQDCGLCATITLARQQPLPPLWKQQQQQLNHQHQVHHPTTGRMLHNLAAYPDSTLDMGISNAAYAHLPDQDSGMGRTTDDSVRTEESSEQEAEEHKALLLNGWLPYDSPSNGHSLSIANVPISAPGNAHLLDNELIHLSQLMQSLAMHCHKLAYMKMCAGTVDVASSAAGTAGEAEQPTAAATAGGVSNSDADGELNGSGGGDSTAATATGSGDVPKARQMPRMGLGATNSSNSSSTHNAYKASSANGIAKSGKDSSEGSAFKGASSDYYYEAVVMPKQPGNPLTLSLSQRQQPPTTHLSAPFDLDSVAKPQEKEHHTSMPPTNPSSIWSIAETEGKESGQPGGVIGNRFNGGALFLHRGSRSSHVRGSNSSCEPHETTTSFGDMASAKPLLQPRFQQPPQPSGVLNDSLRGSKNSCALSHSSTCSSSVAPPPPIAAPHDSVEHRPIHPGTHEGLASNPAYAPIPPYFQNHPHPYEFYDRYYRSCALPPPPLLLPPPPSAVPLNLRYPSPPRPPTWMPPAKAEMGSRERCKDDKSSSNIYETPYAAIDIIGPTKGSSTADIGDGIGDNGSVCFTSYGVLNAAYANDCHSNRYTDSQGQCSGQIGPPKHRPMEWVVKKRPDGSRYITRRPVRNRQGKDRSSRRRIDERGGVTDEDGAAPPRCKGEAAVGTSSRHHSKSTSRVPPQPQAEALASAAGGAGSKHRGRVVSARQSNAGCSGGGGGGRGLVSLTTV